MPETTQFLIWFLGVPVVLGIAMLLALSIEWAAWQIGTAAARCESRLNDWRVHSAGRSARQEGSKAFLAWLAAQAGTGQAGEAIDSELVEAQQRSELIRILVEEEVPKAVFRCVETHRLMANVTGANHMSEIAYEPECYQLRS